MSQSKFQDESLSDALIIQILNGIVDGALGHAGLQYGDFVQYFDMKDWWSYTTQCKNAILVCAAKRLNKDQIMEEFGDSTTTHCLYQILLSRANDLVKAIGNEACVSTECHLADFDWDVCMVLGSDKLAEVNEPLATVKLDLRSKGQLKKVSIEMASDQMDSFIATLEQIDKVCGVI